MCPTDCIEKETFRKDQELEDVLQAVTDKLVAHLFFSNDECTNYRRGCYVIVKSAVHQAVDSRAVCLWSQAIMKKEASLEILPVHVVLRYLDQTWRGKTNNNQDVYATYSYL